MDYFRIFHIILSIVLLVTLGVQAGDDLVAIGNVGSNPDAKVTDDELNTVIKRLETGDSTTEMQGKQMLESLGPLASDCSKVATCSLEDDLAKLDRVNNRASQLFIGLNMISYLKECKKVILDRCSVDIHQLVSKKLNTPDTQSWIEIDLFAKHLDRYLSLTRSDISDYDFNYVHPYLIKAIKELDPEGSMRVVNKMVNKKEALEALMEKIRLPCMTFIGRVDHIVQQFPPVFQQTTPSDTSKDLSKWNFYLRSCSKIIDSWETIMKRAYDTYDLFYKRS